MAIVDQINKKFNSHGGTIEESIKNANVSSGGNSRMFEIEITAEEVEEAPVYVSNKTYAEIHNAISIGLVPVVYYVTDYVTFKFELNNIYGHLSFSSSPFISIEAESPGIQIIQFIINEDDTVTMVGVESEPETWHDLFG